MAARAKATLGYSTEIAGIFFAPHVGTMCGSIVVYVLFREGDESDPTDTTGSLPMDEISEGSGCPCRVLDPRRICA